MENTNLKDALTKLAQEEKPAEQPAQEQPAKEEKKEPQPDSLNDFTIEDRNAFTKALRTAAKDIEECETKVFESIKDEMTAIMKDKKYTVMDKMGVAASMWEMSKNMLYDGNLLLMIKELLQSWFPSDEFK